MTRKSLARWAAATLLILLVPASFTALAAETATAAAAAPRPCAADSAFHLLDFWIGNWNAVDSTGAVVGTDRVEKILDGCAVTETWHEPNGDQGFSLFYYVPSQHQWKQAWVTPSALQPGGLKEKQLIASGTGLTRFQGELAGPAGGLILDRTTLTAIDGGHVRQVIEISRDGGTTWPITFEAIYVLAQPSPSPR